MADQKAPLDKGKLTQAESSRATQKVELDLDDALFLEGDDEPEAEPKAPPSQKVAPREKQDEEPALKPFWKNKWVLLGLLSFSLVAIATTTWLMLRSKSAAPPKVPTAQKHLTPSPKKKSPKLSKHTILLKPFWVEHSVKGKKQFLSCQFSLPVKGDLLKWEIKNKKIILRDAIYYYLKNKDILFLTDKKNVTALKANLLSIINQYLANGQIEEIFIQEYKVQ